MITKSIFFSFATFHQSIGLELKTYAANSRNVGLGPVFSTVYEFGSKQTSDSLILDRCSDVILTK